MGITHTHIHTTFCSLPRVNMFPWKQSAEDWPSLEVFGLQRGREREKERQGVGERERWWSLSCLIKAPHRQISLHRGNAYDVIKTCVLKYLQYVQAFPTCRTPDMTAQQHQRCCSNKSDIKYSEYHAKYNSSLCFFHHDKSTKHHKDIKFISLSPSNSFVHFQNMNYYSYSIVLL